MTYCGRCHDILSSVMLIIHGLAVVDGRQIWFGSGLSLTLSVCSEGFDSLIQFMSLLDRIADWQLARVHLGDLLPLRVTISTPGKRKKEAFRFAVMGMLDLLWCKSCVFIF
jgi:hypothetical protein